MGLAHHRLSTSCEVNERPDHHSGDELVLMRKTEKVHLMIALVVAQISSSLQFGEVLSTEYVHRISLNDFQSFCK